MSAKPHDGITIGEAVKDAAAKLERAGIPSPLMEARLLIGFAIGGDRAETLVNRDRPLSDNEATRLQQALCRRVAHEPVAHIIGQREFWSLAFRVSPDTLIPRPDSETIVEAALSGVPDRTAPLSLLDMGTGSGCLLLALLSELPNATGTGVDANSAALALARDNAGALGMDSRTRFAEADWHKPGWQQVLTPPYDIIIANPPYIPESEYRDLDVEVRQFEPRLALHGGEDGLDAYRILVPAMRTLLVANGTAVVEVGQGQADPVATLFAGAGFGPVKTYADLGGIKRAVLAPNVP